MRKYFALIACLALLSSIPLFCSTTPRKQHHFSSRSTTIELPTKHNAILAAERVGSYQYNHENSRGILVNSIEAPIALLIAQVMPCSLFVLSRSWQRSVATRAPPKVH